MATTIGGKVQNWSENVVGFWLMKNEVSPPSILKLKTLTEKWKKVKSGYAIEWSWYLQRVL